MCYRKVKINGNFGLAKKFLNDGGYAVDVQEFTEGELLIWNGRNKRATRKGPRITATCAEAKLSEIPKLTKGRRKSASQCKNGIYRIDPKTREVVFFSTVKEAAEALGKSPMNIYKCANQFCNELKTAYGYEWTYKRPKQKRT